MGVLESTYHHMEASSLTVCKVAGWSLVKGLGSELEEVRSRIGGRGLEGVLEDTKRED